MLNRTRNSLVESSYFHYTNTYKLLACVFFLKEKLICDVFSCNNNNNNVNNSFISYISYFRLPSSLQPKENILGHSKNVNAFRSICVDYDCLEKRTNLNSFSFQMKSAVENTILFFCVTCIFSFQNNFHLFCFVLFFIFHLSFEITSEEPSNSVSRSRNLA